MTLTAGTLTVVDPVQAAALGYAPSVSAETTAGSVRAATDPEPESTEGTTTTPGIPTMRPDLEVTDVSPGLAGFLAIFVVAVAAILLMLSMTRKLRKVNHSQGADPQASAVFDDRISSDQRTDKG